MSWRPDWIFKIHQLWQSGFSRVYSNCCCSCSFEPKIIKIGQTSYKMYSEYIVNLQESTTILNACTKKVWKLIEGPTYIQTKVDNTQLNRKRRLCRESDETVNHVISDCSKLVQKKYKTKHDCMGKIIHWELCKQLKFDYNTKWYKHKPESVEEKENKISGLCIYHF